MEFSGGMFCVYLNNSHFKMKALWMKVIPPFSMVLAHITADLSWAMFVPFSIIDEGKEAN